MSYSDYSFTTNVTLNLRHAMRALQFFGKHIPVKSGNDYILTGKQVADIIRFVPEPMKHFHPDNLSELEMFARFREVQAILGDWYYKQCNQAKKPGLSSEEYGRDVNSRVLVFSLTKS